MQLGLPSKPLCQSANRRFNRLSRQTKPLLFPFQTTEKQARSCIRVVIGMANIAAIGRNPAREFTH